MASQADQDFIKLALEKGFVTPEQVRECQEAQKVAESVGMGESIDTVMLKKNVLSQTRIKELKQAMTQSVGKEVIPGYTIISKLGQGGMGAVYKARQISMDRIVAIKVLPKSLARNKEFCDRFLREARLAAKFNHPNIIGAFDAGEANGLHYFVMEFVDGETCAELMKREAPLSEARVVEIALQTLKALEFAHNKNIIHRDIKPENIMLSKQGLVKLADLGLARSTQEDSSLTATGAAFGTPLYISPEQAKGEKNLDGRTDLYSFGATLYHMFVGKPPYTGDTAAVVMTKHITEPAPDLRRYRPDISEGMSAIIRKLMAKTPAERFQNTAEVVSALKNRQAFAATAPTVAKVAAPASAPTAVESPELPMATLAPKRGEKASPRERAGSKTKSFPVGIVAAIVLVAAIIVVAAIMFFPGSQEQDNTQARVTPAESPSPVETVKPTPKVEVTKGISPTPVKTPAAVKTNTRTAEELQAEIKKIKTEMLEENPKFKELLQRAGQLKLKAQDSKLENEVDRLLAKLLEARLRTAQKIFADLKGEAEKLAEKNKFQAAIDLLEGSPASLEDMPQSKEAADLAAELKQRAGGILKKAEAAAERKADEGKFKEAAAQFDPFRAWDLEEIREQAQSLQGKYLEKETELRLQKEEKQRLAAQQKYWEVLRGAVQSAKEHQYDKAIAAFSSLKSLDDAVVKEWVAADVPFLDKQKQMWNFFENNIGKAAGTMVMDNMTIRSAASLDKIVIGGAGMGEDISCSYKSLSLIDRCSLLKEVLERHGKFPPKDVLLMRFITVLDEKKGQEIIEKIAAEVEGLRSKGALDKHYAEVIETLIGGEKEMQAQTAFATLEQLVRQKAWPTLERKLAEFDQRYEKTKFAQANQAALDTIRQSLDETSGAASKLKKVLNCAKVEKIGANRYRLTYDFNTSSQLSDFGYTKSRWRVNNGELLNPGSRDSNSLSRMSHILQVAPNFKITIEDFQKDNNDGIVIGYSNVCAAFGARENGGSAIMSIEEQNGKWNNRVLTASEKMLLTPGKIRLELEYKNGMITASFGAQKLTQNIQVRGNNEIWLIAGFNNRVHRFDNLVIECEPDQNVVDQLFELDKKVKKAAQDARITVTRGLIGTYYKGVGFKNFFARRLDASFDYPFDNPVDNIGDTFSVVWEGYIFIPAYGDYQFVVSHDDDAIFTFDGKDVENVKGYTPPGNAQMFQKSFAPGLHKLKVEHWDQGGLGFMIVRMRNTAGQLVPLDSLLYHEPSQEKNLN